MFAFFLKFYLWPRKLLWFFRNSGLPEIKMKKQKIHSRNRIRQTLKPWIWIPSPNNDPVFDHRRPYWWHHMDQIQKALLNSSLVTSKSCRSTGIWNFSSHTSSLILKPRHEESVGVCKFYMYWVNEWDLLERFYSENGILNDFSRLIPTLLMWTNTPSWVKRVCTPSLGPISGEYGPFKWPEGRTRRG